MGAGLTHEELRRLWGRVLELARTHLGMDVAWISRVEDGEQVLQAVEGDAQSFGLHAGQRSAFGQTYCSRVVTGQLPNAVPDARRDARTSALPITADMDIGAYVGVPVQLPDGSLYGMLCCLSHEADPELAQADVRFLELLSQLVSEELQRTQADRESTARRRNEVEAAVAGEGLSVVFQPIVDVRTMAVKGVEALARFAGDPPRPDLWFADARAHGLGVELELAAARAALAVLPELPDPLYLSINASPAMLWSAELAAALDRVPAHRILLEVTEHEVVEDYDRLEAALAPLRERGARVAVDDAGAGYASLRHILRLRPEVIKLDIGLTRDVDADPVRGALAQALVSFAAHVGATLVAEGVETPDELAALFWLGVPLAQGYLLGRPAVLDTALRPRAPAIRRLVDSSGAAVAPLPVAVGAADGLEVLVRPLLQAVVALTGLESAYFTVVDHGTGVMERRYAFNAGKLQVREGSTVAWERSLCRRCQDRGLVWTADVPHDLPGGTEVPSPDVQTFMSVPVVADGQLVGTLCAAGTSPRRIAEPVVATMAMFAGLVAEQVERLGGREVALGA